MLMERDGAISRTPLREWLASRCVWLQDHEIDHICSMRMNEWYYALELVGE